MARTPTAFAKLANEILRSRWDFHPTVAGVLAPTVILELFKVFDRLRQHISIVIVEHNLDLVLALADRVFALERGAVFHEGPAQPLLTDLEYQKKILWL